MLKLTFLFETLREMIQKLNLDYFAKRSFMRIAGVMQDLQRYDNEIRTRVLLERGHSNVSDGKLVVDGMMFWISNDKCFLSIVGLKDRELILKMSKVWIRYPTLNVRIDVIEEDIVTASATTSLNVLMAFLHLRICDSGIANQILDMAMDKELK